MDWLNEVWKKKRKGAFLKQGRLLIFDSMCAHLTDLIKSACKKAQATIAFPGCLTKILQLLDITINCAFKFKMHKCWEKWMCCRTHSFVKSGCIRNAMYKEVAE